LPTRHDRPTPGMGRGTCAFAHQQPSVSGRRARLLCSAGRPGADDRVGDGVVAHRRRSRRALGRKRGRRLSHSPGARRVTKRVPRQALPSPSGTGSWSPRRGGPCLAVLNTRAFTVPDPRVHRASSSWFGRPLRVRHRARDRYRRSQNRSQRGYSRFGNARPRPLPNRESLLPRMVSTTHPDHLHPSLGSTGGPAGPTAASTALATVLSLTPSALAIALSLMPSSRRWFAFSAIFR
jgi:hypothetical protein